MDGSSPPAASEDDAGYLKAVANCGDKRPLLAAQPIYSSTGVKLLDAGAKIDGRIIERLFGHSLAQPIDQCVTSPEILSHKDLLARAHEFVEADARLAQFESSLGDQARRLWGALGECPLPPAIAVRLTVVRENAPWLFDHMLRAACVALYVGVCARYSDSDLQLLASAALLHDIGMMHADPALYEAEKPLGMAARRSLYAHPLIGELIARREPLLSPAIATAIAQHHERLDGSGYPKGLQGEQIGKLARVLMLVELIMAALGKEQPWMRLSLMLRLNHRGLDSGLSAAVLAAAPRDEAGEATADAGLAEYRQSVALIQEWRALRNQAPPSTAPVDGFITARIDQLSRWLADAGAANPEEALAAVGEDPALRLEIEALGREALWQARQIAYDAMQRWPHLQPHDGVAAPGATGTWILGAVRATTQPLSAPSRSPAP